MNIITISREFGSGGRELAKRLAEFLGYKYYDKEIIREMIKLSNFNEAYIEKTLNNIKEDFPYTTCRNFSFYSMQQKQTTQMLVLERKIILELAKKENCVFVGRCADIILKEYKPLDIFVYASLEHRLNRCKTKGPKDEGLTDKELLKKIKNIDKSRKRQSLLLGSDSWGIKENYNLCINTTDFEIKDLVPFVKDFAKVYFKEN